MGDMVGELQFGSRIQPTDLKKFGELNWEDDNANTYDKLLGSALPNGLTINTPYETDEVLVIVKESFHAAFNGSIKLGDTIQTNPEWIPKVQKFLDDNDIKTKNPPQWYLVGRYG